MAGPWDKTRVTMDGRTGYMSRGQVQALDCLAIAQGWPGYEVLTVFQFGWRPRTTFSGETHMENAADLSPNEWRAKVRDGRKLGIWMAHRTSAQGNWDPHIHLGMIGNPNQSDAMQGQIREYLAGGDGLLGNRPDPDWRPLHPEVQFVPDARVGKWTVTRQTQGRTEAGTEAKLAKPDTLRAPGYVIENMGTVKIGSKEYLVTKNMTFYEKAHVTAGVSTDPQPEPTPDPVPVPIPPPPPPSMETILDVGHWNVASPRPGWFPVPWADRQERIGQTLAEMSCSIITCNETHFAYQTRDILRALGDKYHHVSSPIGNDIFFDDTKYDQVREYAEYDLGAQNRWAGVLHLVRVQTGQRLTVVNTHLPYASASLRSTAAKNLVNLLADVDDPIILCGDFNNQSFSSGTPHYRLRRAGFKFMREQAIVTNATKPEYPAKAQWLCDIATDPDEPGKDAHIVSGALLLTSSKLSDHRPLKARITIK